MNKPFTPPAPPVVGQPFVPPAPPAPPGTFTPPASGISAPQFDQKSRILIFDFSNLAYQALFAVTRTPEVLEKEFDGHYRIFISKVQALLAKMSDMNCEIVFALDSFPQAKKDIYPGYKEGRKKFDFDPKKGLLSALSNILEFKIAKVKGYEADDVIGSIVAQNPDKQCVVISSDKDLWVLMKYDNCNIYSIHKNEYVTHEMFVEEFKVVNYHHLTLVKTLWGDTSDAVPNKMPRAQKHMLPLINESDGTLGSLIQNFDSKKSLIPPKVVAMWEQNEDQIVDNYSLVSLNCSLEFEMHKYVRGLEYQL